MKPLKFLAKQILRDRSGKTLALMVGVVAACSLAALALHLLANPPLPPLDSDGDGASDVDESSAGTDPHDPSSVFKLLSPPARLPGGGWRVSWASVAGKTYHVERAANDQLGAAEWVVAAIVTASGPISSYDDPNPDTRRFYRVRLKDVVAVTYFVSDPDVFVPILNGVPNEGQQVAFVSADVLAPFDFRPEGRSASGLGQGLFLRFPNGARLTTGGQPQLEFTNATLNFGPRSPWQFASNFAFQNDGAPQRLPVGPVEVSALAALFNGSASNGLPLVAFGKFPLTCRGGVWQEGGIQRAKFSIDLPNLPLPAGSAPYEDLVVSVGEDGTLRLPFSGEFALPDGSAFSPRAKIAADRPMWVELRPGGEIALGGRADVSFTNGPKVTVDFLMDDPRYHLQFVAQGIHWNVLNALAGRLPEPPGVPIGIAPGDFTPTLEVYRCLARAYCRFSGAVVSAAPADVESLPSLPAAPGTLAAPTAVLDAWGCSALAVPSSGLSFPGLEELFQQSGESAAAGRDLQSVICFQTALQRAKTAVTRAAQGGGLSLDASTQAKLDSELQLSVQAAIRAASSPDAVTSWRAMSEVAVCLLELKQLLQQIGSQIDSQLDTALADLVRRFGERVTTELAVNSGEFSPPSTRIAGLNRAECLDRLRTLLDVLVMAQQLGIDDQLGSVAVQETMTQLALQLWLLLAADLNAAEAARDTPGFAAGFAELLELVRLRDSGLLANTAALDAALAPTAANLNGFVGRLAALLASDRTPPLRSPRGIHDALRGVMALLHRGSPSVLNGYQSTFSALYNALMPSLDDAMSKLGTFNLLDLGLLLRAGVEHDELADALGLTPAVAWKNTRLDLVVNRLIAAATSARNYSDLCLGAGFLFDEAARRGGRNEVAAMRRYMEAGRALLVAMRGLSGTLAQAEARRRQDPGFNSPLDLALRGDIYIDKVAGAISYDRHTRLLAGAFSGQARVPNFGLALTVANASINSGGAFDVNLHGQLQLPLNGGLGSFTILARRPLHLAFTPPNSLRLSGGARLALANGMSFASFVQLEDPLYGFGLSAAGLRFDLATNMFGYLAVPDAAKLQNLGPDLRLLLGDYFQSMAATADPLSSLLDPPQFAPIGTPPDFATPEIELPSDALNACATYTAIAAAAPFVLGFVAADATATQVRDTVAPILTNIVKDLRREAERAANELDGRRSEMEAVAGELRDRLAAGLADAFREAARTMRKLAEASERVRQAQAAGRLPDGTDVTPGGHDETQHHSDATRTTGTKLADEPGVTSNVEKALKVLEGYTDEEAARQKNGSPPDPEFDSKARKVIQDARTALYDRAGLNPDGTVRDPEKLQQLAPEELDKVAEGAAQLEADGQGLGVSDDPAPFVNALSTVTAERRRRTVDEVRRIINDPNLQPGLREEQLVQTLAPLIRNLTQGEGAGAGYTATGTRLDGSTGSSTLQQDIADALNLVGTSYGKMAEALDPDSPNYSREYAVLFNARKTIERMTSQGITKIPAFLIAATNVAVPMATKEVVRAGTAAVARRAARDLNTEASSGFKFPLLEAPGLAQVLKTLASVLDKTGGALAPPAAPAPGGPIGNLNQAELDQFRLNIFPKYTLRLTAVAEGQKAWWIAGRVTEVFLDGLAGKAVQDLDTAELAAFEAARDTLALSSRVLGVLRDDVRLRNRPVEFPLPSTVVVERVFGEVFYNRQTGLLSGAFGGRLDFPDLGAYFEITRAALDNQLHFDLNARAGGPLPFQGVRINSAMLHVTGGPAGVPFAISGSGAISIRDGPEISVAVSYDSAARRLAFDTQAGRLQSLRLTDEFVIFDAGFGFTLSPGAAELRASGSAGMFKNAPLPTNNVTRTNFYLFVDQLRTSLAFAPGQVTLSLSNGTLRLPGTFDVGLCTNPPALAGPAVALSPQSPVRVEFLESGGQGLPEVNFGGRVDFRNLGFLVPGFTNFGAELCAATLQFTNRAPPVFTNINGVVLVPLPPGQTTRVEILKGAWSVTGFPSGKIALGTDIVLITNNGFKVTLPGLGNTTCPLGTALTVWPAPAGQLPSFVIDGGIDLTLPANLITGQTGDVVRVAACGSISNAPGHLPQLTLGTLAVGGTFHLGGARGLLVENGSLTLRNLQNVFNTSRNPPNPFTIDVAGIVVVPSGPGFGLQDTHFVFNNLNPDVPGLPEFVPGTFIYQQRAWALANLLPFQVREARLRFKNGTLALPDILSPANLEITVSARLALPSVNPVFAGEVNSLKVSFANDGVPSMSISAVSITLDGGAYLSPMSDLKGQVYLGGLDLNPIQPFFTGKVGGTYQTYKLSMLVAFTPTGLVGFCIDVNAGAAGVPLGPTGFLWTGASGGYSFLNQLGDPCDFTAYMDPVTGRPVSAPRPGLPAVPAINMDWAQLRSYLDRAADEARRLAAIQPAAAGLRLASGPGAPIVNQFGIPCPDSCPPPTVNIFCQPHPDQENPNTAGRIILKFTSIDEATLNNVFGITEQQIIDLKNQGVNVAATLAHTIRAQLAASVPAADPRFLGDDLAAFLNSSTGELMNEIETGFTAAFTLAANNNAAASALYAAIRDVVYAGLPCPDVTFKVAGSFSYAGVSSFAYVTGEGIISTTGSGGVGGKIYVVGVPFGRAKLFVSATDAQGDPNPSACGDVNVAFGPLELGQLRAKIRCDRCVTTMLGIFGQFVASLSQSTIDHILGTVAPEYVGRAASQLPTLLTQGQKIQFIGEMASLPPNLLPPNARQLFRDALGQSFESLNPEIQLCGEVKLKLFGLPLGGDIYSVAGHVTKTNMTFVGAGSPIAMLGLTLAGIASSSGVGASLGAAALVASQVVGERFQEASSVSWADPAQTLLAGFDGKLSSPQALLNHADATFDYLTQNAIHTVEYSLSPMGLKSFDAQGRIILPNLTAHPAFTGNWVRPENRQPPLPSRLDLVLSALTNHLPGTTAGLISDPNWKGRANDLFLAFPAGSSESNAVRGLSFADDYFPHGGFIAGVNLAAPRALYDAPPEALFTALDQTKPPLDRVLAAISYVTDYLLSTRQAGALAFYVPAPNPPSLVGTNGQPLSPRGLLESINQFDITNAAVGALYPAAEIFASGWFEGDLLGVPVGRARLDLVPPDFVLLRPALFRVTADVPANSWLNSFVDRASLVFDLAQSPSITIENTFSNALVELTTALAQNGTDAEYAALAQRFADQVASGLPKVKLETTLTNFHFPTPLASMLGTPQASANFGLFAYSPRFQTNPAGSGPITEAKRNGGIVMQGDARIAGLFDANVRFVVRPQSSGLPALAAHAGVPLIDLGPVLHFRNGTFDLNTAAAAGAPFLAVTGRLDQFDIGVMQVRPLAAGTTLAGQLEVLAGSPNQVSLRLDPASIGFPTLFPERLLLYGAARNQPFTFSSSGPWSATIEMTNDLCLLNLIQLSSGGFAGSITLSGNGASSASFTTAFTAAAQLTVFPGHATLQRTITLQPGVNGGLTLASDGQFRVTAQVGGGLSFGTFTVPGGASMTASNGGIAFSWTVGGSSASLLIAANGTIDTGGSIELPPIIAGVLKLTGANGGNLRGSFINGDFAVNSGARLTLDADWLQRQALTLTAFTVSNNGAVNVSGSGQNLALGGFTFDLTSFTFTRQPTNSGGAANFALAGGVRTSPNLPGFPSLNFTGSVSSAGAATMKAGVPSATLFGFPVRNCTNSLSLAAGQFVAMLQTEFLLGDGTGPWAAVGSNWFRGTISSDGAMSCQSSLPQVTIVGFSLNNAVWTFGGPFIGNQPPVVAIEGDVAVNGFPSMHLGGGINPSGGFYLVPSSGGPIPLPVPFLTASSSVSLANTGLFLNGFIGLPPLPGIGVSGAISNTGGFRFTGTLNDGFVSGYRMTNLTVVVERQPGQAPTLAVNGATLFVPGISTVGSFARVIVNGAFTNDGTFALTGTIASPSIGGLPVPGINGSAQVSFTHNGLTVSGNLATSGGVLASLVPVVTASGVFNMPVSGAPSVSATVTVPPLSNGVLRIGPSGGGNFAASLDNAGLHLPAGAVLTYSNYLDLPLTLPEIVVQSNGDFSFTLGESAPLSFRIKDFTVENVRLSIQRSGGVLSVPAFSGRLRVPGVNIGVDVSGSFPANGQFILNGAVGGSIGLASLSLPVNGMTAAGATLTPASLTITGSLSGAIFDSVPGLSAAGQLTVTSSGVVTLSGSATVNSPLTFGAFQVQPVGGGPTMSAIWSNNALTVSAGNSLRLYYGGQPLANVALPDVQILGNGDFSFTVGSPTPVTVSLGGFTINNSTFTTQRTLGVTTVSFAAGSLSVPALNSALNVAVNGTLRSDGAYALNSTANTTTAAGVGSPLLVNLGTGASARLENDVITLTGGLSGGVFNAVSLVGGGVGVNGSIRIVMNGGVPQVTPSATATISRFDFGAFQIRPSGGGDFVCSLGPNGLTLPDNAQLWFNGAPLGLWTLPRITIPAGGGFSGSLNNVSCTIGGFTIGSASFSYTRTGSSFTITSFNGSLGVPGFQSALNVNVSGSVDSSGSYTLSGLNSAPIAYGNPTLFRLDASAGFTLNNGVVSINGTVRNGVLDVVGVTATASITIYPDGRVAPVASVTHSKLVLTPFELRPVEPATTFTSTLSASGLRLPSGVRLYLNGVSLGGFDLPSIIIPGSGDFHGSVGPVAFTVNGYNLGNAYLTYRKQGGTLAIPQFSATLALPSTVNSGGASAMVSGSFDTTGSYSLVGANTFGPWSLAGLPISQIDGGLTLLLSSASGLTLAGGVSGSILNANILPAPLFGSATGLVSVASGGALTIAGTVVLPALEFGSGNGRFAIEDPNGGNLTATWNNSGLFLPGFRLSAPGVFGSDKTSTISFESVTIQTDGTLNKTLSGSVNRNIVGYPCANISMTVTRTPASISLNPVSAQLGFGGFNQTMNGSITAGASLPTVTLDYDGSLVLGGFNAPNSGAGRAYLDLRTSGLTAGGSFDLTAQSQTFNSGVSFFGSISTGGAYTLTGTGSLTLQGGNISSTTLVLTGAGVTGTDTVNFGKFHAKAAFTLTSGGIGFSASTTGDSGWRWTGFAGVFWRAIWSATLSNSGATGVAASFSADLYAWDENHGCLFPPCAEPALSAIPACQHIRVPASGTVGINSNGDFTAGIGACGAGFEGFSTRTLTLP